MKTKDIAKQYGIDQIDFESFLEGQKDFKVGGIIGFAIDDKDVAAAVNAYKKSIEDKERAALEKSRKEEEKIRKEQEKKQAVASMLVTSGFNFDGYSIKKYSGYISGDDAIQINRDELFNNNGKVLTDSLVEIRIKALKELKEAAYDLGCNAVIGVDFDYMTFEPESIETRLITGTSHVYEPYVVCVTANGNAVVIEKNS